jgi:hypothetical protein
MRNAFTAQYIYAPTCYSVLTLRILFLEDITLLRKWHLNHSLSKGCHLDVVRGPSTPHDPESDAGGSLSSWQGHTSR